MKSLGLFDVESQDTPKMVVLRLVYRNFKRFESYELEPDGENLTVFGDNETGKSTLVDGFMWLLFDKDSLNRKDFEIKKLDEDGEPAHRLEHEVEGTFLIDGKILTLRKVLKEKWTKKRGSPVESFEGHETAYFVGGVPTPKGQYDQKISSIMEEQAFRLLSDPRYFNEVLHWTKRREILMEVCGDVPDADVIASDPRLSDLTDILEDRTLEEHRKVVTARKAKINKELQGIPIRINEATRNLPECDNTSQKGVEAAIKKSLKAKEEELARIEHGQGAADKTARLLEIRTKMADMEAKARRALEDTRANKKRALDQAQYEYEQAGKQYRRMLEESQTKAQEALSLDAKLNALRLQWEDIDSEEFQYSPDMVCPTCGQDLPSYQIEEAREKAQEAFNLSVSQRLEKNEVEGKAIVGRKKQLESESQKYQKEMALYEGKSKEQSILVERLQKELSGLPERSDVTTPEYNSLAMEREQLTSDINDATPDTRTSDLQEDIKELKENLRAREQIGLKIELRAQGEKRIAELLEQEKKLTQEFEKLEQELYLTEEFMRIKVHLLEDRIASKFSFVRFRMFVEQVNGGLSECCETLVKGVPYSKGLNNAAKIQAGLDIINTLGDHYNFIAPIWLDNAEAFTWRPETKAQVISLYVSAKDKTLRVEKEVA